jgi:hypothetical protein
MELSSGGAKRGKEKRREARWWGFSGLFGPAKTRRQSRARAQFSLANLAWTAAGALSVSAPDPRLKDGLRSG